MLWVIIGYMVRGLVYSLVFLLLFGCCGMRCEIARQQSRVVELSILCEQGDSKACSERNARYEELRRLLNND